MLTKEEVDQESDYSTKLELIRPALLSFAQSRVYNQSDSHDVVQDTLVILQNKRSDYDPTKSFYSWAFKVCHFQIMKTITKNKRNREIAPLSEYGATPDHINHGRFDPIYLPEKSPEASADSFLSYLNASCNNSCPLNLALENELLEERKNIILKMASALKGNQRLLFDYSLSGKSKKEIMELMNMTGTNYQVTKSRVINKLKKFFGK